MLGMAALPHNRAACVVFLLVFWSCAVHSDILDPSGDIYMDMPSSAHDAAQAEEALYTYSSDMQSSDAPHHHFKRILSHTSHHHTMRISMSDLQSRKTLEQSIQIAAFEQFGRRKTGELYNVSVSAAPTVIVQAMRLRSGSFRRYGVTIRNLIIPPGCQVHPIPERILLIYVQLLNTTLFQSLPGGYVLASPVVGVFAYDALNLNSAQLTQQLNVSTTTSITIQFAGSSNAKCASFDEDSINVSYTDLVQGACQVTHIGTFASVTNATTPAPLPSFGAPITLSPPLPSSHSDTWKVVVGSVVGGFVLLILVSLLALGIAKRRKKAKFAKMQYQAEFGETLQTTTIRNSRVPAAGSTRTLSAIEREYSI